LLSAATGDWVSITVRDLLLAGDEQVSL